MALLGADAMSFCTGSIAFTSIPTSSPSRGGRRMCDWTSRSVSCVSPLLSQPFAANGKRVALARKHWTVTDYIYRRRIGRLVLANRLSADLQTARCLLLEAAAGHHSIMVSHAGRGGARCAGQGTHTNWALDGTRAHLENRKLWWRRGKRMGRFHPRSTA